VDGARLVRIFGQQVPVRARIATVGGLSAHADQAALLDWLGGFRQAPRQVFVVHGEAASSAAFATAIKERHGWREVRSPLPGESVSL
jgi:metallo-beta-lactamase family protein